MSDEKNTPPASSSASSPLSNPQVVAALITGIVTVLVALISVLPNLINATPPAATPVVIIATATALPPTATPTEAATEAETDIPTNAPTDSPTDAPTNAPTDSPTNTPTSEPPTRTPEPPTPTDMPASTTSDAGNVRLMYDDVSFTLLNRSGATLSLEGITFTSANGTWDARQWGTTIYNSLPHRSCLRLRDQTSGQRTPPSACESLHGLQLVGNAVLFWLNVDSFNVLRNGEIIATCPVSDGSCLINIP